MPQRIQRRRTRGWRMPEGAVYVGRPSKWGNPFDADEWGQDLAVVLYGEMAHGMWNPSYLESYSDSEYHAAASRRDAWRARFSGAHPTEVIISELAGLDLACWCPLDQPCHADVLLEIANGG